MKTFYGGSPVIDLLNFIIAGSDDQFQKHHYETLLNHYYTQLYMSAKRLNLDPNKVYSRVNFQSELKEVRIIF